MKNTVMIVLAGLLAGCASEFNEPAAVPMVGAEPEAAAFEATADPVGDETAHVLAVGDYSTFEFEDAADRWDAVDAAEWGDIPLTPPAGYYDDVDESSSTALRDTLHTIIRDTHVESYKYSETTSFPGDDDHKVDVWDIVALADESPTSSGRVIDLYRNEQYVKQFEGPPDRIYDREHVWPKSYGFKKTAGGSEAPNANNKAYVDCHHLFAAQKGYNSRRNNRPFGPRAETSDEFVTLENHGRGGDLTDGDESSNWGMGSESPSGLWEVWLGRRGDVARAVFYMDVRYEGDENEAQLSLTNTQSDINQDVPTQQAWLTSNVAFMGLLDTLLGWHDDDPVDDLERHHTSVVFIFQGNRNPFIDHPEWVTEIYGP